MVEQPLAPGTAGNAADLLDHAELARVLETPICLVTRGSRQSHLECTLLWWALHGAHQRTPCLLSTRVTSQDESLNSLKAAQKAVELGSGGVFNIKPGRCGGSTIALQIMALASEHGIPCWIGGMLESAVGAQFCTALVRSRLRAARLRQSDAPF
jgi:hypothetical protein|eukprot:COSAG01_NODE_960_length_12416_cov_3.072501_7_plen_155_part_00